jgi:hypothetical protein
MVQVTDHEDLPMLLLLSMANRLLLLSFQVSRRALRGVFDRRAVRGRPVYLGGLS